MLAITHARPCGAMVEVEGNAQPVNLVGLTISLPDEVQYPERVLDEFTEALADTEPFVHAVRFEDERLRDELALLAGELFDLEMKLRRVLTFIYLHAYPTGHPRDLLFEEKVRPTSDAPPAHAMATRGENPFFYLTFSQYTKLNERPQLKPEQLLALIGSCNSFDVLQQELRRRPVEEEDDAGLLAGLQETMSVIERMRNSVAHNRRPSERLRANYQQAVPVLDGMLDTYLSRLTSKSD
jgi:hypothetical protein